MVGVRGVRSVRRAACRAATYPAGLLRRVTASCDCGRSSRSGAGATSLQLCRLLPRRAPLTQAVATATTAPVAPAAARKGVRCSVRPRHVRRLHAVRV